MASSVDLGNQLDAFVSQLVKAGHYNSRGEILGEGVRLIHERETKLAALDASIMRGVASADAGRVHGLEDVAAKLGAKYANMAADQRPQ